MEILIKFIDQLVPYISFISFGMSLFLIVRGFISGRTRIELFFPENYSTCLSTHPSNEIVKHLFSLAIVITNKSSNPIIINSILFSDGKEEHQSDYDSKHISHMEANQMSISGEMIWYRKEICSTELPIKLEAHTAKLITFYFATPISFVPTIAKLITDKKVFYRDDIASFVSILFNNCENHNQ